MSMLDKWRNASRTRRTKHNSEIHESFHLETLEPRLLLSADPTALLFPLSADLSSVSMRLLGDPGEETLQVLDDAGIVQVERALSEISQIIIEGTDETDDTLNLDFNPGEINIPITFDGGAGGNDTLRGPLGDSIWTINGDDSGEVEGIQFIDVENLVGAPDNEDTFIFEDGGTLIGLIDGGEDGFDTLVISFSDIQSLIYSPTGPDSGSINADGNIIHFAGLEPITVADSSGNLTVDVSDNPADLTLEVVAGKLRVDGSSIEQITANPGTVTSVNIVFGSGSDSLTIGDVTGFDLNKLTVTGGDGTDTIKVTRNDDMTLTDTSLDIGGDTVTLVDIEQAELTGGGDANTLDASAFSLGSVTLYGMGGNDILRGGSGDDYLYGGDDDDDLYGNAGNDAYYFGSGWGDDTVWEAASGGSDTLDLTSYPGAISVTPLIGGGVEITGASNSVNMDSTSAQNVENILETDTDINADQMNELIDGVDSLIAFTERLMAFDKFDASLPILRDDSGNEITMGQLGGLVEMLDELRYELAQYLSDNAGSLGTADLISHINSVFGGIGKEIGYLGAAILSPLGIDDGDVVGDDLYAFRISTASGFISLLDKVEFSVKDPAIDTVEKLVQAINGELVLAGFAGQVAAGSRDGRIYFQILSEDVSDLRVSAVDVADNKAETLLGFPEETLLGTDDLVIENAQNYLRSTGDLTIKAVGGASVTVSVVDGYPKIQLHLNLEGTRTSDFGIQLGDEGDGNGIVFSDLDKISTDSKLVFDIDLGVATSSGLDLPSLDYTPVTLDEVETFELDVNGLKIGIDANSTTTKNAASGVDTSQLSAEVGFLAVYAEGELDLDAGIVVNLAKTTGIIAADLADAFDTDGVLIDTDASPFTETDHTLIGGTPSFTVDLQLRIDDHINPIDNFNYLAAITTTGSTNPFIFSDNESEYLVFDGNTEGSAVVGGFQHFLNFTSVDPTGILSVLQQYATTLNNLRTSDLLHAVEIPFISAGLDQLLDWAEVLSDSLLYDEGADDTVDGSDRLVTDLNDALRVAGLGGLIRVQGDGSQIEFITADPDLTDLKIIKVDAGIYAAFGFGGTSVNGSDDGDVWRLAATPAVLGTLAAGTFKVSYKRNGVGSAIETEVELAADALSDNTGLGDDTARLLDENNSPTYQTAQEFAQLLRILGVDATDNYTSGANYDSVTERLTYEINVASSDLFAFELPTDFALDLEPLLDVSSDTRLVVTAEGGLDMIIGFDLSDAGLSGGSINGADLADYGVEVKTQPAITAETAPSTIVGRLSADAHFNIKVTETDDNEEDYDFTITAADTSGFETIGQLVTLLNTELANDAALDGLISFEAVGNKIKIISDSAGSLKKIEVSADSADPAVSQLGLPSAKTINSYDFGALDGGKLYMAGIANVRAIVGRLSGDAAFTVTLNYTGTDFNPGTDTGTRVATPVTVKQTDAEANTNILDVMADVRNAFTNTYLGNDPDFLGSGTSDPDTPTLADLLEVSVQGSRLVITVKDTANFNDGSVDVTEFRLTAGTHADELGFGAVANNIDSNDDDLLITQADGTSFTVAFDSSHTTFDQIISVINAAALAHNGTDPIVASYGMDDPTTPIDEANTYIKLSDPTFTSFDPGAADPNTAPFTVEAVNGSKASIQLGLNAGLFDPTEHPTGAITGKPIGGITVSDRFFVSSTNLDEFLTAEARAAAGRLVNSLEITSVGGGETEVTTDEFAFTDSMVGLDIEILNVSGFTAGTYSITAVDEGTNTATLDAEIGLLDQAGGVGILKTGVHASAHVGYIGLSVDGTADLGLKVALGLDTNGTYFTDSALSLKELTDTGFTVNNLLDIFNLPQLLPHPDIQAIDPEYEFGLVDLEVSIDGGSADFNSNIQSALLPGGNPEISIRIVSAGDPFLGTRLAEANYVRTDATHFVVDGNFEEILLDAEATADPSGDEQYLVIQLPPVDPDATDDTSKPSRAKIISAEYDTTSPGKTVVTIEVIPAEAGELDSFALPTDSNAAEQLSLLPKVDVDTSDLSELLNFEDFGFSRIIDLLQAVSAFLGQFEAFDFLDEDLPVIDQSFNDLLGFAEQYGEMVLDAIDNPASTLQVLENKLNAAIGISEAQFQSVVDVLNANAEVDPGDTDPYTAPDDAVDINFIDGKLLQLTLSLGAVFTESLPVGFSIDSLDLPAVFEGALDLSGFANLSAEGAVLLTLDVGIDTETGEFYVLDGTDAVAGLTVGGENISFTAGIGPFSLVIGDKRLENPADNDISEINLQAAAGVGVDFTAFTPTEFDSGSIKGALLDVSSGVTLSGVAIGSAVSGTVGTGNDEVLSGSVDGRLPVFFPNDGNWIGDILIGETFGDTYDGAGNLDNDMTGYGDLANISNPVFRVSTTDDTYDDDDTDADAYIYNGGNLVIDLSQPLSFFADFNLDDLSLFSSIMLAVDGLDYLMEFMHDLMQDGIGGFTFPIIGDDFSKAAGFFQSIRDELIGPLREAIETVEDAALDFSDPDKNIISGFLFELLGPEGLDVLLDKDFTPTSGDDSGWDNPLSTPGDAIGLMTNYDDYLFGPGFDGLDDYSDPNDYDDVTDTEILWTMSLGQSFPLVDAGFDFDVGIPGLGLDTEGDFDLDVWWTLDLAFGLSMEDGFFFQVLNDEGADPEAEVHLEADFSEGTEITGRLAFLQLVGTVKTLTDSDVPNELGITEFDTGIDAAFSIDLFDKSKAADAGDSRIGFTSLGNLDVDFHVEADATVALGLELGLNEDLGLKGFPSVIGDFLLYWEIDADIGDLSGDMISDGLKVVSFFDIQLDLGEYVSEVLGPIVNEVAKFTEPMQPIIDIMTTPIPPLAQLGVELTLLDLAGTFGDFDPSLIENLAEVITLINDIAAISDVDEVFLPIADQFVVYNNAFLSADGGGALGDFVTNLTSSSSQAGDIFKNAKNTAGVIGGLVDDVANAIGNIDEGSLNPNQQQAKSTMSKMVGREGGAFGFPILQDPMQVLGLLMGEDAVLVTYDMGRFFAEFEWSQFFPIYGPLGISVGLEISAEIQAGFGFDTAGIREFAETGFENPLLILNGFYISDRENPDGTGLDRPELTFLGGLKAAAELNLGIAKAGVGGGLFIEIDFDLFDPNNDGKIRITELIGNFENEWKYGSPVLAPLAIFDVSGEIYAQLFAFLEINFVLFSVEFDFDITPPITLLEFGIDFTRPPILATEFDGNNDGEKGDGDLIINTGRYAETRLLGTASDIGETLTITKHDAVGGLVQIDVTSPGAALGEDSDTILNYHMGVGHTLKIDGGLGNDNFTLIGFDDDEIYLEIDLGEGDDILDIQGSTGGVSGDRFNIILGGEGKDVITGTGGRDLIVGGTGVDTINAGGGDDLVIGDAYEESGPTLEVKVNGTDSGDILNGEGGQDILIGGGGVDEIHGGANEDLIIGDGAVLTFNSPKVFGNLKGLFEGGVTNTDILTTSFGDKLYGDGGEDIIFGGNGGDTIEGGAADDIIFGGMGPDTIKGDAGDDIIFGDVGFFDEADDKDNAVNGDGGEADTIEGGAGEDLILGGGGGDIIYGDDKGDPTNGDADTIFGNSGPDVIYGNGGDDWIYGNAEGDRLYGDAGDDALDGGAGGDLVKGGDGDDVITATKGNDFLDGQEGSDNYLTKNQGGATGSLISVIDSGLTDTDTDILLITGTPFDDTYLLRSNTDGSNAFVALLNDFNAIERINYSKSLERIKLDTSLGDDYVAVDDTAAEITIDGNLGDDTFQIGQMFRTQRTDSLFTDDPAGGNVAIDDIFLTIETTRGWLSNGISLPMTIEGSEGNDEFTVFHNKAVLSLNGGDGDDMFTIRAFALAGSQEPQRERTDLTGGAGADLIQYAVNAPVNIDGGDGFDTLIVIGTEFGDDFVITRDGIYGAGLNVNFVNIESLRVDGAEGNDRFFVQSTNENVLTEIFGGLGEDTFFMSGDTPPVVSNDLLGHSGLVLHNVGEGTDDERFEMMSLYGISANVADNDEPFAVIRETDGSTIITESEVENAGGDWYEVVLTRRPLTNVVIKALAPLPSTQNRELGAFGFRVDSPSGIVNADGTSVSLTFTPDTWFIPQVVHVYADSKILEDLTGKSPIGGLFVRPELEGFETPPITDDNGNGIADALEFDFDDDAIEGVHYGVINHVVQAGSDGFQDTLLVDTSEGSAIATILKPAGTKTDGTAWEISDILGRSISIIEGIGIGDSRYITDVTEFLGSIWVLTLNRPWQASDLPDTGSTFQIRIDDAIVGTSLGVLASDELATTELNSLERLIDVGLLPSNTLATLSPTVFGLSSALNSYYMKGEGLIGRVVEIIGGTGAGQQRLILGYYDPTVDSGLPDAIGGVTLTENTALILNGGWRVQPNDTSIFRIEIYDGLVLPSTQVQVNDNDFAGIHVDEAVGYDGSVVTDYDTVTAIVEGGDGDQRGEWDVLNVKLSRDPVSGSAYVAFKYDSSQLILTTLSGDPLYSMTDGSYSATEHRLVFTTSDWSDIQTVLVKAIDDNLREGFHNELIEFVVTGGQGVVTDTVTDRYTITEDNPVYFVGLTQRPDPDASGTTDGILHVKIGTETITPTGGPIGYVITGNKIIFTDGEAENPALFSVIGDIEVQYKATDPGFAGTFNRPILARLADDDAPTVLIRETGGSTDVIETTEISDPGIWLLLNLFGADTPGFIFDTNPPNSVDTTQSPWTDTYEVVLTDRPDSGDGTGTVTVILTPDITKTTRTGGIRHDAVQVALVNVNSDSRIVDNLDGTFTVTFNETNWDEPVVVGVKAIDDSWIDGNDTKEFAPGPNTLSGILGPVIVDGAGGAGSMAINYPLMLPGETNIKPPTGNLTADMSDGDTDYYGVLRSTGTTMTVNKNDLQDFIDENDDLFTLQDLVDRTIEITSVNDSDNLLHTAIGQFRQIVAVEESGANAIITINAGFDLNVGYEYDPLVTSPGETAGDILSYAITEQSLNFFVDETTQIDVMFVDDSDSPADSSGTLTTSRLYGLNMGPDITIGDQLRPGGITYNDLEVIDIDLGVGNNTLDVLGVYARDDNYQTWTIIHTGDETIPWQSDPENPTEWIMGDNVNLYVNEEVIILRGGVDEQDLTVDSYTEPTPAQYASITSTGTDFGADDSLVGMQVQLITIDGDPGEEVVAVKQSLNIVHNSGDTLYLEGEFIADITAGDDPDTFPEGLQFQIVNPKDGNISVDLGMGNDTLNAAPNWGPGDTALVSTKRIIAFGGEGNDFITGGSGDDILFGDKGRVDYFNEAGAIVTRLGSAPEQILGFVTTQMTEVTLDTLVDSGAGFPVPDVDEDGLGTDDIGLKGLYVDINNGYGFLQLPTLITGNTLTELYIDPLDPELDLPGPVSGNESEYRISTYPEDQTDGVIRDANLLITVDIDLGGNDIINAGSGNDQVFGGTGEDAIDAGEGDDIVIGDGGRIDRTRDNIDETDPEPQFAEIVGSSLTKIRTIDFFEGGADEISGGAGEDMILGGMDGDTVYGDNTGATAESADGNDIIIGDNGEINFNMGIITDIQTTDYENTTGGGDTIHGNAGNDIILGGVNDGEIDVIFGDAPIQGDNDGDDLILGDNGTVDFGDDPTYLDSVVSEDSATLGGVDTISGNKGADTIIGGTAGDTIYGDNIGATAEGADGDDVIAGDNAEILYADDAVNDSDTGRLTTLGTTFISSMATTDTAEATGGDDTIEGNAGSDLILGGVGGDTIYGDRPATTATSVAEDGDDLILGDNGTVDFGDDPTYLDSVVSEDSDTLGGEDTISGNKGADTIIGGTAGDTIYGDNIGATAEGADGDDVIAGDNAEILYADDAVNDSDTGRLTTLGTTFISSMATTDTSEATGGNDTIEGNAGSDLILGGVGGDTIYGDRPATTATSVAEDGDDLILGDNGTVDFGDDPTYLDSVVSEDSDTLGGEDTISGNKGADTIIGGTAGDTIYGDNIGATAEGADGDDVIAGDNAEILYADDAVNDSDTGRLTTLGTTFISSMATTDTSEATGGNDTIEGNAGSDLILGGVGGDTIYGDRPATTATSVTEDGDDLILGDNGTVDFGDDPTYLDSVVSEDSDTLGGEDTISGNKGADTIIGGSAGDTIYGDNIGATAEGADGDDVIAGDNAEILYADDDNQGAGNGRLYTLVDSVISSIATTDTAEATGGDDTIEGNAGSDLILGGVGGDTIYGDRPTTTATSSNEDGDDVILGDNGELDFAGDLDLDLNPAAEIDLTTLDRVETFLDALGGNDIISGNAGADLALGGTADDTLYGDNAGAEGGDTDGNDILLGDNGIVLLVPPYLDGTADGSDRILVLGGAVGHLRSTDNGDGTLVPDADDTAGSDTIDGNAGGDIILGGSHGDDLYGDRASVTAGTNILDGNDIILGDNGALEWLSMGRVDEIEGINVAAENPDLVAGFTSRDHNLDTLDLVTTEQPNNGGRDMVYGDNGRDVIFGGTDADTLYGDTGSEDDGTQSAVGNDLMFGDHGHFYPQFSRALVGGTLVPLTDVNGRNFFAIDVGQTDGGEGDRMWGEEGDDIMLGQQGDDRMWGGSDDDDMIGGHNVSGGADELETAEISADLSTAITTPAISNVNDLMDGGAGNDAMTGDNAIVWRRGDDISPRFRILTEDAIYTTDSSTIAANVLIGAVDSEAATTIDTEAQSDPADAIGRDINLLDHADDTADGLYGADVMAGGADSDVMFGQLANDLMQGDGYIGTTPDAGPNTLTILITDSGTPDTGGTLYFNIPEAASDGDDYLEGNGGGDLMYGGLGQDDIIGGSSELFGMVTEEMRPDGSDVIFGGAGVAISRNDIGATSFNLATEDPETHEITTELDGHARDADFIMGDNANVYRLVVGEVEGVDPDQFLDFNYDDSYGMQIIPRAMEQLDYTLGGADFAGGTYTVWGAANDDNGAADLIRGESGDDIIFGMTGSDVLFGDGQDDDIVGGYGSDWISGGTGSDGVLGDDGLILTSRNSTAGEPLYGIEGLLSNDSSQKYNNGNALGEVISTPGKIQYAVINVSGELKKTVDLVPFSFDNTWMAMDDEFPDDATTTPYADDIIFGGLGSDWLHGGSGDDAISGAEALEHAYVPTYDIEGNPTGILDMGYTVMGQPDLVLGDDPSNDNPGDVLAFNPIDGDGQHLENRFRAGEFALYDEYDPRRKIMLDENGELWKSDDQGSAYEFLLNFEETEGVVRAAGDVNKATGQQTQTYPQVNDDGSDAIFGDLGNDWLVGGTGRDNIYGGWGNDLLNADDVHDITDDGTKQNTVSDTHPTYEDRAYGGAGRDILIGNTGGDRLIDWVGEYNTFLVPYAPFGQASVSRTMMPHLQEFLYALSAGDGADPTRYRDAIGGDEPEPTNNNPIPSRNGEPHGELGMVIQKDFAWQDQTGAPSDPQAGNIPGGHRDVLRSSNFNTGTAASFAVESGAWDVSRGEYIGQAAKYDEAISLFYVNEYLPNYYEMLATVEVSKAIQGYKSNGYIIFDYYSDTDFKFAGINVSNDKLEIGQRTADGWMVETQSNMRLKYGIDYNLMIAVNGTNATLVVNGSSSLNYTFAPREVDGMSFGLNTGMLAIGTNNAISRFDNVIVQKLPPVFDAEISDDFSDGTADGFNEVSGSWSAADASYHADASGTAISTLSLDAGSSSFVELEASITTDSFGGLIFDYYSETDYKFVAILADTGQVVIGHATEDGLVYDAVTDLELDPGVEYTLGLSLHGSSVSVTLDSQVVAGYVYNSLLVDGDVGLLSVDADSIFDDLLIQYQL